MGDLMCEELIEEILSRLPNITYLIKCKYVSKSWNRLVSNVCCQGGPTVGVIGLYATVTSSNELRILYPTKKQEDDNDHDDNVDTKPRLVEKKEIDCIMETTKCLELYQLTHLLDSCNGLILCRCFDEGDHCYYVGNPILNQWTLLPPPPKADYYATTGFVFDGIHDHHYKILHLFIRETTEPVTNRIQCQVFYSETGQWREHQAKVLNSLTTLSHCIKLIRGSSIQKQGLYLNGALHWTFACDHKYMLVFYVEKEVFRFIELPGDHGSNIVDRMTKCLWESKGFLHYAVSVADNTFHVWKNTNDHGNDNKQQRWVFIQTIRYASMVRRNLKEDFSKGWLCIDEGCSSNKSSIVCVPIEYLNNDGSRAVNSRTILKYFCDTGVLDESSAKTQRVSWTYTSTTKGISRGRFTGALYPYVFNLVDLPIWDGCILLKHPN